MILFINPLKKNITFSIIENSSCILEKDIIGGDDFGNFPETLIEILDNHPGIQEIWNINGPGAFTRMRIITLTLNTLHTTKNIILKGCHFFDLIEENPILQINNQEYLLKNISGEVESKTLDAIEHGEYTGYLLKNDFTEEKVFIEYNEDWEKISKAFSQIREIPLLSPIYLKAPHITCSKKNISLS